MWCFYCQTQVFVGQDIIMFGDFDDARFLNGVNPGSKMSHEIFNGLPAVCDDSG